MNKIRRLGFLILLALVCSSVCWSQSNVWQRASKTSDLAVIVISGHKTPKNFMQ
jgi:hypothetical protein